MSTSMEWRPAANQADKVIHGTNVCGERNSHSKITAEDVVDIRREYRLIKLPGSGRSVAELDLRYGLHRSTIVGIATGKRWKHIPMPSFEELAA